MSIGKDFIKVREYLNYTQSDLAKKLGVSFATINRIENGICVPRSSTLDAFNELCIENGISFNEKNESWCKVVTSERIKAVFLENKYEAIGKFPLLIEELIKESGVKNITKKEIPSLSDINMPGFDLVVECESSNRFVPNGKSVWELGVREDNTKKITSDLTGRTKNYSKEFKIKSTYVGCTPFPLKEVTKQKNLSKYASSGWKDIRLYDSFLLEDWMSYCPNATSWFMKELLDIDVHYSSFKSELNKFINLTLPELNTNLFIKEREEEVRKLMDFINEGKRIIAINGPSFWESYGFVLSSIESNLEYDSTNIVVVNDKKTLKELQKYVNNKVFILKEVCESISFDDSDTNIYIIFKPNKEEYFGRYSDIKLSLRPKEVVRNVLVNDMKFDSNKADNILIKTGASVLNVMRKLNREGSELTCEWENRNDLVNLIPILFSGKVNIKNQTDRDILSKYLENQSVDTYYKQIVDWKNIDNTPLYFYEDYINVNYKSELWFTIKDKITENDVKKVVDNLNTIFSKHDPKYELKEEERMFAALKNKQWEYESYQIGCMFDVLKLFAIYNDKQDYVDLCINKIFNKIKTEEQILTISRYFYDIVECSPTVFINYVDKELKKENHGCISYLFKEAGKSFFSEKYYPSLLTALEKCTCFEDTKISALNCLAKLTNIECNYGNSVTPFDSLVKKLLPFNNNSALTINDKRQFVINTIENRKINVELLVSKLLKTDSFGEGVGMFLYREPVFTNVVTYGEIWEFRNLILDETIELSTNKEEIIIYLLNKCHYNFRCLEYDTIIKHVKTEECKKTQELYEVFIKARYHISGKNSELEEKIESLIIDIKPNNILEENLIYLSSDIFDCPMHEFKDIKFSDREEKIVSKLLSIFSKLKKQYRIETIINKIYSKNSNANLDWLFECADFDNKELIEVSESLLENKKYFELARILLRYIKFGKKTIRKYDENVLKELLVQFGKYKCKDKLELNDLLENDEYLKLYYLNFHINNETEPYEIDMVKKYNTFAYFEYVAYHCDLTSIDVNELLDLLDNYSIDVKRNHDIYVIERIIKQLDEISYSEKLALLEYKYISMFDEELPKCLTRFFYINPIILLSIYEIMTNDENIDKKNISYAWYKLRFNLKLPADYARNIELTENFIYTLINYKKEDHDTNEYMKEFVGEILARSSEIRDFCPSESMMILLEKYNDDVIARGFVVGFANAKGVRTVTDGSDLFKNSENYKKKAVEIENKYPNTAYILKKIADDEKYIGKKDRISWLETRGIL